MKLLSAFLLVSSAVAFSPAPTFGVSRTASRLAMIPDPELINHLAQNAYDAVSVTIQECDNTDCVMVDGFKTTDNSWVFSEGLGDRTDTYQKVMSMTMKDTE